MNANYRKLGEIVELIDERNKDGKVQNLIGVSIDKCFIKSVANTIGTDLTKYQVIRKNDFACSLMQVSRDGKIPIACLKDYDEAIMSPAYYIFRIKNTNEVLPDYLAMWFMRTEFDREASYIAVGGVRGSMPWEDFCDMKLPVPDLKEQEKIVNTYNAITKRIQLKQKINENLSKQLSCLYENLCSEEESKNWKDVLLDEIVENKRKNVKVENIPDNSIYVGLEHIPRKTIVLNNHGNSEEVLSDKQKASKGDILFGKIRPYFHKVSVNPYDEIYCSGDALVFNSKQKELYGFVLLTVFSEKFVNYAVKLSNGAKMPRAEWKDLKNYTVRVPDTQTLNNLNEVVNKSLEYIYSNLGEIAKLQELKQLVISRISGM
ncbi:MAG: restriction endonuclease subunit S [Treponema sp.]|nr:restriction endonuclease subunit S [Treponema sp.]MBO6219598.1 restriction endonuclease subunit S [Treponema sp.]